MRLALTGVASALREPRARLPPQRTNSLALGKGLPIAPSVACPPIQCLGRSGFRLRATREIERGRRVG